ncbi:ferredoxin--NADP reductase [Comamonas nitrativorans]|uniref:Ferredoxin--NADP reductase n=1 Tax=Comamonas nitrativorans TaxID=108437 RepID=A0ABV9GTZ9_9BURK
MTIPVQLLRSVPVAQGTTAFHFSKPAGFGFKPGQACDLILPGQAQNNGADTRHAFSIVSAPHEDELVFATRMRDSPFKRALAQLQPGTTMELDGPFGSLTLHKKAERAAVFIAGGIGITPFMSMVRHAAHSHSTQPLVLLYSNRRPEDAAFLTELQALAAAHAPLRLIATMTDMAHATQPWDGATGAIDSALLQKIANGLDAPIFYVSGPPPMVAALRDTLEATGIDEDDVRSEEFYGY